MPILLVSNPFGCSSAYRYNGNGVVSVISISTYALGSPATPSITTPSVYGTIVFVSPSDTIVSGAVLKRNGAEALLTCSRINL